MIGAVGVAMVGGLALLAAWGLKQCGVSLLGDLLVLFGAGAVGFALAQVLA